MTRKPVCIGCGLPERKSPGFLRYLSGWWCLACRRRALELPTR